ncbi:MAG: Gfo/Idh/MocA family oxidoreductase [Planctomycetota bacterium]|nr:Gfo/Idh/MocA family oxidoreductase [Planctomycetota bacterium]
MSKLSRRDALKLSLLTGAMPFVRYGDLPRLRTERLRLGIIGVGNRGAANLAAVGHEHVVALCDVDDRYLKSAANEYQDAATFRDYREMLNADLDLDAVVVSTPDHTHAPASMAAMQRGLHCYCEKPLTHSVEEAKAMAKLGKGLVTQMGTQIHAGDNYRRVVELMRTKPIGNVTEVHVWCGKDWSGGRKSAPEPSAPEYLDWKLWLGDRADRPYRNGLHPGSWRRFWEFGGGTLADMGCHYMDLPFWALELGTPKVVTADAPEPAHPVGTPKDLHCAWTFDHQGHELVFHWYDGSRRPDCLSKLTYDNGQPVNWNSGVLFVGEDGMVLADYGRHYLLPEQQFVGFTPPPQSIPSSIGHHREWLEAIRSGGPTTCHFAYSGNLTHTVLLGNQAYRAGGSMKL